MIRTLVQEMIHSCFWISHSSFLKNSFFRTVKRTTSQRFCISETSLDRRKFVNFNTLSQVRTRFIDKINEYGIQVHCILGNHDTYYRNTNRINSIRELFSDTDNFHLYEDPVELEFGGLVYWNGPLDKQEQHRTMY